MTTIRVRTAIALALAIVGMTASPVVADLTFTIGGTWDTDARRNAATAGRRDLDTYRLAAGDLQAEVRRHFRWYYDEGLAAAVGAARATRAA